MSTKPPLRIPKTAPGEYVESRMEIMLLPATKQRVIELAAEKGISAGALIRTAIDELLLRHSLERKVHKDPRLP